MVNEERVCLNILASEELRVGSLRKNLSDDSIQLEEVKTDLDDVVRCKRYKLSCGWSFTMERLLLMMNKVGEKMKGSLIVDASMFATMDEEDEFYERYHKEVQITLFSFGLPVQLSKYVELYNSSKVSEERKEAKISRIQANFMHNQGFADFFFREDITEKGKSSRKVYRIKITYGNIRRVLSQQKTLRNGKILYDTFLFLRHPPTLHEWLPEKNAYDQCFQGSGVIWKRVASFGTSGFPTYFSSLGKSLLFHFQLPTNEEGGRVLSALVHNCEEFYCGFPEAMSISENVEGLSIGKPSDSMKYALACVNSIAPHLAYELFLDGADSRKKVCANIEDCARKNEEATLMALYKLYNIYQTQPYVNVQKVFDRYFKAFCKNDQKWTPDAPFGVTVYPIKQVICTPTRLLVLPPTAIRTTRLLSDFDHKSCLIVKIRDDCSLKSNTGNTVDCNSFRLIEADSESSCEELVDQFIKKKLIHGIKIGGKVYEFFGTNRSSAERHEFWAYCKDEKGRKVGDVLKSLGTVVIGEHPGMKMKALGMAVTQCIASTKVSFKLCSEFTSEESNEWTRGIGTISVDMVKHLQRTLNLPENISCLAVIHGGFNGILMVDPDLQGKTIRYHSTQKIFNTDHDVMYITKVNSVSRAYMDPLLISILSDKKKGVTREIEDKSILNLILLYLFELLEATALGDSLVDLLPNIFSPNHKDLRILPWLSCRDAFARSITRDKNVSELYGLKRLHIPLPKESCFQLMAVVDLTKSLDAREVFIKVKTPDGGFRVLDGPVIISRVGAMLPSQVRVMIAVDKPELHHLDNVLVLPQFGAIPAIRLLSYDFYNPDDEFVVIKLSKIRFFHNDDHVELDEESLFANKNVYDESPVNHFLKYFRLTSSCPSIVNFLSLVHLVGTNSKSAQNFALLFEQSRQYFFGYGTSLFDHNLFTNIFAYPDFMEKYTSCPTYCTPGALGKIYRRVKLIGLEYLDKKRDATVTISHSVSSAVKDSDKYDDQASNDLILFKKRLETLLLLRGYVSHEQFTKAIFGCFEWDTSEKDMAITLHMDLQNLQNAAEAKFFENISKDDNEEILKKISAYYRVSQANGENGGHMFWWMVPCAAKILIEHLDKHAPQNTEESEVLESLHQNLKAKMRKQVESAVTPDKQMLCGIVYNVVNHLLRRNRGLALLPGTDTRSSVLLLEKLVQAAFDKAWDVCCQQISAAGGSDKDVEQEVCGHPAVLVTNAIRALLKLTYTRTDPEDEFAKMNTQLTCLHNLLINLLAKIALEGNFDPIVSQEPVVSQNKIKRVFLIPLDYCQTETDYILLTSRHSSWFHEKLQNLSGCDRVFTSILHYNDSIFQEVTAFGLWYAVDFLITLMFSPEFKKIIVLNIRDRDQQMNYTQ